MEAILLRIILSTSTFILIYFLFLQKEKTFRFNRFYLLFALFFSYIVPFIPITKPSLQKETTKKIINEFSSEITYYSSVIPQSTINWKNITLAIYLSVTLFILVKKVIALYRIHTLKGKKIIINGQKTKIINHKIAPFSFWNTVYIGEKYYQNNIIDERIWLHECNHIKQKHSVDILIIEFLKTISWFNPVLYFYKNAIVTNHEFLADEYVLDEKFDVKSYQYLILQEIEKNQQSIFINQFNYNKTKKRFIMMTKPKTKYQNAKKNLIVLLMPLFFFAFAEKRNPENVSVKNQDISILPKTDTLKPKSKKTVGKLKSNDLKKIKTKSNGKENDYFSPALSVNNKQTPAEFPGGNENLRMKLMDNFDMQKLNLNKTTLTGNINVLVAEDGKSYTATYDFDNDIFRKEAEIAFEKTVKDVVWIPGTQNGTPVKSYIKVPFTMIFE